MTKAQSKVAVPPGNVVTRSVSNVTVCEPVEEVKMVSPEQPIPGGSGGGGGGGGGKIALASCTATAKGRPLHIGKHDRIYATRWCFGVVTHHDAYSCMWRPEISPKFENVQNWRVSHAVSYFKGWSKCTAGSPSGSATPGL